MRPKESLPPDYFERMFAASSDPWEFETSPYEQAKYDATLDALGERRYRSGLEIGCANGVLTNRLAFRCNCLVAIDVSETALGRARRRCEAHANIAFQRCRIPDESPRIGPFDLILMSEVAYYWTADDLARVATFIDTAQAPNGDLLLVHWIGETDYPQSGDAASEQLIDCLRPRFSLIEQRRETQYRLDLLRRHGRRQEASGAEL